MADFGLARSVLPQDAILSVAGEACGTPRYMAPEQLAGLPADIRSDLYSFGMVLSKCSPASRLWKGSRRSASGGFSRRATNASGPAN